MVLEDSILKKFRAGNDVVFKEIFDCYYLPVKSYAFRYVGDDEVIEDFVQETFLGLWKKREGFFSLLAIKSFLYTSVRNASLDYLRHLKVQQQHEQELILWLSEEEDESILLEDEVHAMIYEAIKDLSEQSRRAVIMTMNGASNPEIAKELGVSVNTVKTIKLRAYRALRSRLKGAQWLFFLFLINY